MEAGIRAVSIIERDIAATFTTTFKSNGNPSLNYLILDQGMFYLDLCTTSDGANQGGERIRHSYIPALQFGTYSIDRDIADRLVSGSEELQVQINLGAHKNALWDPIRKARFLIRDDLDTVLLGAIADEDHHLDEYPLELNGWGIGDVQAVLSWEDVQAAEMKYVEAVGQKLRWYLSVLRQSRIPGSSTDEEIPERIDKVVILTDGTDGRLLKRVVHKALGEHIEIIGGTVHGFYLAAFGAARRALMFVNSWYDRDKKTSTMKGVSMKHNDLYHPEL